jgi:hypothetical protein
MESSLFPVRFSFDSARFEQALRESCSLTEQLDMNPLESAIVVDEKERSTLIGWLSRVLNGRKQCSLVYRATHNGWNDQKLQEIAERIGDPVLFVGKTDQGHVFGGFQSSPWSKANSFSGQDSFLFSLDSGSSGRGPVLVENCHSVASKQFQYSPRDLRFQLSNKIVASQLGHSFRVPHSFPDSANNLLLGGPQATLIEAELFCIGNVQSQGPKLQAILRGKPHLKQALAQMIKRQYQPSNLLYKASRDGWFASTFHQRCDEAGPTLVIAKSEHGHIFGGFADKDWGGRHLQFEGFIQDPLAVLFSLTDGQGRAPALLNLKHAKTALQNNNKLGPCFGQGNDLRLNLGEQRVQCNPHSYIIPTGFRQDTYLAGHSSTRLDEVEVYSMPNDQ